MDNLPVHKVAGVGRAIEAAGATLEMAFSKFKAHLRKAPEHTIPGLLRRIGRVVEAFTPQECRNSWRHAEHDRNPPLTSRMLKPPSTRQSCLSQSERSRQS